MLAHLVKFVRLSTHSPASFWTLHPISPQRRERLPTLFHSTTNKFAKLLHFMLKMHPKQDIRYLLIKQERIRSELCSTPWMLERRKNEVENPGYASWYWTKMGDWELGIDRRQRSSKNYRHIREEEDKDRGGYTRSASHFHTSFLMVCVIKILCYLYCVGHPHLLTHESTILGVMDGRSVLAQTKLVCKNGDWCLFG